MLDAKVVLWWRIYLEPKMWYKQVVETITGFISVWVASTARCGYNSRKIHIRLRCRVTKKFAVKT